MTTYNSLEEAERARDEFWAGVKHYSVTFRDARLAKGLRQRDVAEAVGVDPSFVSRIEAATERPGIGLTQRLCDALDLPAGTHMLYTNDSGDVALMLAFRTGPDGRLVVA